MNTPAQIQQAWGPGTPYGAQRYTESGAGVGMVAPPLVHTQSMPALTMGEMDVGREREREKERGKTPRKKGGIFLR